MRVTRRQTLAAAIGIAAAPRADLALLRAAHAYEMASGFARRRSPLLT